MFLKQFARHDIDALFNRLIWRPPLPAVPCPRHAADADADAAALPRGSGDGFGRFNSRPSSSSRCHVSAVLAPRDWGAVEAQWRAENSRGKTERENKRSIFSFLRASN